MLFEFSCHGCQKRYPGCHGSCEAYKQEKARYDEQKAKLDKQRATNSGLFKQRDNAVARSNKRKRG